MATPHVTGIIAYAMAANATLAKSPGLMKEWVRMQALDAGDGILVANNGVQGPYQNQKRGEEKGEEWKFARRAFSGLDALMVCARSERMSIASAWLCNAKRSLGF